MGRRRASKVPETVVELRDYLQSIGVTVVLEHHTGVAIEEKNLPLIESSELHHHCDLLIIVGGDGSLINAAHIAIKQNLPVVGINRGRIGFLTDIHPDEKEKLQQVIAGHYKMERRPLLEMSLTVDGERVSRLALNDVVLSPSSNAHMMDFQLKINNEFVSMIRADGMIAATPTGSTAYALSAGGPIIQPNLNAIVLVPMFPHTLTSRPIVVPDSETISLVIDAENDAEPFISTDGQEKISVPLGSTIEIKKYNNELHLIHPEDYEYFSTLREKLGWNHYKKRA